MPEYAPPLDQLLRLGDERLYGGEEVDYVKEFGAGPEHVAELIRMAKDVELHEAEGNTPLIWAPVHAWRTLAQLRAEAAIAPLLEVLTYDEEHDRDVAAEEMPRVFQKIGPAAIPALQAYMADAGHTSYGRGAALGALEDIAKSYPEARAEVVATFLRHLKEMENNENLFNSFLIAALEELDVKEASALVDRAYEAGLVEESYSGTPEHVHWAFGPRTEPEPHRWGHGSAFGLNRVEQSMRKGGTPKERAAARRKKAAKEKKRHRKKR